MTTSISDELAASLPIARRIRPTHGYYRKPNGDIGIATNTELEQLRYIKEGWKFLGEYGAFDMTPYVANHPFEGLLMFGGAKEMAVEQIIATGLYFDPPLVPRCRQHITQFHRSHTPDCWRGAQRAGFPQLADVPAGVLGPFPCEFCVRKLPTVKALRQHKQVAHAKEQGNLQQGESLGTSLAKALSGVKPQVVQEADPEKAAMRQKIAELEAEKVKVEKRRATMKAVRAKRKPKETAKAVSEAV